MNATYLAELQESIAAAETVLATIVAKDEHAAAMAALCVDFLSDQE
jgi:hypothetical protein